MKQDKYIATANPARIQPFEGFRFLIPVIVFLCEERTSALGQYQPLSILTVERLVSGVQRPLAA
jgi:hypothetical protein